MKINLNKDFLEEFDTKKLTKAVIKKFDEYNVHLIMAQQYYDGSLHHELKDKPESFQRRFNDPTGNAAIYGEKIISSILDFEEKIEYLKSVFTPDELMVYQHNIEGREIDDEVMYRMSKSDTAYRLIKKSCYVKIALRFNLQGIKKEKTEIQAISQMV